ncbi:MAG: hypothetical protein JWO38_6653 [Gemmataceae bacterium]|nr:hypothetical protein [Gemmataceae bacterium]
MPPPGYEPFLAAICANPDDDTPRLVYADWLDETGDPDRAELIRLEVRLAAGAPGRADRESLKQRQRELIQRNRDRWLAELPRARGFEWTFGSEDQWNTYWRFDRGFVGCVTFWSAAAYRRAAARVFRATPVRAVSVCGVRPTDLALFTNERFSQCRSLCVNGDELGPGEVERIVTAAPLQGLTYFRIYGAGIGDDAVDRLCEPGVLPNLTVLWMDGLIGDRGVETLAASHHGPRLEGLHLNFQLTHVGDRGARVVAKGAFRRLKQLSLGKAIQDPGAVALARSPVLGRLDYLYLDGNRIGETGAIALKNSPQIRALKEIYLRYNPIPKAVAERIERDPGRVRVWADPVAWEPGAEE